MQSSTTSYDDLITILEQEFSLCSDMVTILQKEKDVITGLNTEALDNHLRDKELVAAKITVYEEVRVKTLESLGMPNKTLTEVAAAAGPDYSERLSSIASRFKSITHSITELHTLNSLLIGKSLFYVRASRNFLKAFGIEPSSRVSMEA
ncbi:MAG: flagellar protein FlgN [Dissulfurispiraceae bacterium]|jgi:flagellar biosynthesis/type III secretory pathway chaperone